MENVPSPEQLAAMASPKPYWQDQAEQLTDLNAELRRKLFRMNLTIGCYQVVALIGVTAAILLALGV